MTTLLAWVSLSSHVRLSVCRCISSPLIALLLLGPSTPAIGQTTTDDTFLANTTLGDRVWEDRNENGIQDPAEPGLNNVVVNLLNANGVLLQTTSTDSDGLYTFTGLAAGSYLVEFDRPGFRVELVWNTPGDPDQSDTGPEAGSDVDLHLAHPLADTGQDHDGDGTPDPWFDQPYDTFWFNPHPNWGQADPEVNDDPYLDRDDTDGAGAEVISLRNPEDGATYRIGVHYWADHNYGPSTATVRVYVNGALVFEDTADLANHAMWEVATVDWPGGTVTAITKNGQKKITPNYPMPFSLRSADVTASGEQFLFTVSNQGTDDALDSDAGANGWSPVVNIIDGETNLTVDAGLIRVPGSCTVWLPHLTR